MLQDHSYRRLLNNCSAPKNGLEDIATNSKSLAKDLLIQRVQELFDAGAYVEIATHDHGVIRRIIKEVIEPDEIPSDCFEFQFLTGVQEGRKASKELQKLGYKVRFYVPCELAPGSGIPYLKRRLIKNPGLVWSGAKNVIQVACK
ncbi:proline dehydrogenase family protein [Candidatus Woesearchaeota archaeon]|nr:proline dehydrogenase family protein [Candidatus Woesearchaeota archaeon]